jgi:hypothetical protein
MHARRESYVCFDGNGATEGKGSCCGACHLNQKERAMLDLIESFITGFIEGFLQGLFGKGRR